MSDLRATISRFSDIVGAEHVLTAADLRAGYETDWTRRYRGSAVAVVRPADTAEVAAVVRACTEQRLAIVPQGGNTGLVGGAVPPLGSIVLSLLRLDRIQAVDITAGQLTVGAGATLGAVGEATNGSGWEFGVDLGARDTATIGGMFNTNAGGVRVLRHGSMRANVLGVEAVLPDGSVVSRLSGLVKDNTGYDLGGLLCGSEGTLGVITAARLRLVPEPSQRFAVWLACRSWADAVERATWARLHIPGLDGLEAIDAACQTVAEEQLSLPPVLDGKPPVALLVAWAGGDFPERAFVDLVGDRASSAAADAPSLSKLWAPRERQAEAIARTGIPHKLDVTVPFAAIASFTTAVSQIALPHRLYLFGHLGDGNLHVNLVGPASEDDAFDDRILRAVADHGGSISAEHGIGRAKQRWLHLSRSAEELAAFAAIKRAFDPTGIMNPGVLLPADP